MIATSSRNDYFRLRYEEVKKNGRKTVCLECDKPVTVHHTDPRRDYCEPSKPPDRRGKSRLGLSSHDSERNGFCGVKPTCVICGGELEPGENVMGACMCCDCWQTTARMVDRGFRKFYERRGENVAKMVF